MIRDEYLPLASLVPDPANYNIHGPDDVQRMCGKISEVGFTAPFLVDAETKIIAGGHLRRLALLKLKDEKRPEPEGIKRGWLVPCRLGEWSEVQRLKVLIGDNPDLNRVHYDSESLADLLASLDNQGELLGTGYDAADLDALVAELGMAGKPAASDRLNSEAFGKGRATVALVLPAADVALMERALRATGEKNRGKAALALATAYLDAAAR